MSPRVTVLLPCYNGAKFVGAAIQSVLRQTFEQFELLIVDDCSQDETKPIIDAAAETDSRIRILTNDKNLGLFQNYNRCIQESRTEYIKPFAQDDLLAPEALHKMVTVLDGEKDVALVSCAREYIALDHSGKLLQIVQRFDARKKLVANDAIADNLFSFSNWIGEPCAVMFRKEHAGLGFCTDYWHYGDIEYWLRILSNGAYIFLPETLVQFRSHQNSGTQRNYRGLGVVSDVWRLAHTYEQFALSAGRTKQEFYDSVMKNLADEVYHSVDSLGVMPEQIWKTNIDTLTPDNMTELLARSLLLMARLDRTATSAQTAAKEVHARMQDLHSQIEILTDRVASLDKEKADLQEELSKVHQSMTWRISRKLSRALGRRGT